MYNYQIFQFPFLSFAGAFCRRQMGQRMNYDLQDEEVGRRRHDDVLALALLIFERWEMANSYCFVSRGTWAMLIL